MDGFGWNVLPSNTGVLSQSLVETGLLQEPPFIFLIIFYQKPLQVQKYLNLDDSYRAAMVLCFPGLHAITCADSKGSWFSFGVYQPEDQIKSGQQHAPLSKFSEATGL